MEQDAAPTARILQRRTLTSRGADPRLPPPAGLAAEEPIEKGIPMGIEKGIAKGILVGEALLLRRLLTRRFGPVPGWVEDKLAGAEPAQLEAWGERVLDAPSLEGVFAQP